MADEMRQILIQRFEKQDYKEGFFDVTFNIKDNILHAHRFLLSAVSEPFQAMFSKNWNSSSEPIEIKTCSYEIFKQFIAYFYHGNCDFDESIIFDITDLAEMYQVQALKNQFDEFLSEMSITDDNIFRLLEASETYGYEKLKKSLSNYLVANWKTLFERDNFLTVKEEVLLGILGLDRDGNESIENALFEKIFTWAENKAKEKNTDFDIQKPEDQQAKIKNEMKAFVPKFQFTSRSMDFLNDYVAARSYIFDDWEGTLEKAKNTKNDHHYSDYFCRKFQILPYDFNGEYHQVLRGTTYAETEEPLIELTEFIKSLPYENGAYEVNCQTHVNLKYLKDLIHYDDGPFYLGFHCYSRLGLINRHIFDLNQGYFDVYDFVCDLEGENFPGFEKEENYFWIQLL